MEGDAFQRNILAVADLVSSNTNKQDSSEVPKEEVSSELQNPFELPETDEELQELARQYETLGTGYDGKVKPRQEKNRLYYAPKTLDGKSTSSNYIFSSFEQFIPQALAETPEPVVWSDDTPEGKQESDDLKTMLQYHATIFSFRALLSKVLRQWNIYFTGILKFGWDKRTSEITVKLKRPRNFIFDPDGWIDVHGHFHGRFIGERIPISAKDAIETYGNKEYISEKVGGKLGTMITVTEWWNDDYCFTTFMNKVLDKHVNEYFNYDEDGEQQPNHFAVPLMPYLFLSIFSLEEEPLDITNLTEQAIPNQDRINERDMQISKNLASSNNSVLVSGKAFTVEAAAQVVDSFYESGFLWVPNGDLENAVKRLPANDLPSAIFTSQENDKNSLQQMMGVLGTSAQPKAEDTTAHGMVLNQSFDTTRTGQISDALERYAESMYGWCTQLYHVFYDEEHYSAIMGTGRAINFTEMSKDKLSNRKFVVTVAPNSMKPRDEVSEMNQATQLAEAGWLDPINLYKKINDSDPLATAKMVTLFRINPQAYYQQFFPDQQQPQGQGGQPPPQGGNVQPEQGGASEPAQPIQAPASNAELSNAPLPKM